MSSKALRTTLLFISLVFLTAGCLPARFTWYNFANITDHKIFPNRSLAASNQPWEFYASPNPIEPKKIAYKEKEVNFDEFLHKSKTVAFIIIRNDTILSERYLNGYAENDVVASFSMAKSFTSALVGIAIEEGILGSENDTISQYIPELAKNGFNRVTIKHLLQMTSGLKYSESYISPFSDAAIQYYGRNLEKHLLKSKLKNNPGEKFAYTSGTTQLLGYVLHRALNAKGMTLTQYLQLKIWGPTGMESDASWSLDKKDGLEKTFCCINAIGRDFARMGRLYLHKGARGEHQIVPSSWVSKSTAIDTTDGSAWFYQYQWWLASKDQSDFLMNGHLGQFVYVHPAKNLIIVRLGKKEGKVRWTNFFKSMAEAY